MGNKKGGDTMNESKLLVIFNFLDNERKKDLYNLLKEFLTEQSEEKRKEWLEILEDLEEDLLYEDDVVAKQQDIFVTMEQLAKAFGVSKKTIARIINARNVKPVNPGRKPYLFNLDDFIEDYHIYKNTKEPLEYIDYTLGVPMFRQRPLVSENETSDVSEGSEAECLYENIIEERGVNHESRPSYFKLATNLG